MGKEPSLQERVKKLSDRATYRLIELLDPEVAHYEFFLGRAPLPKNDWSIDEKLLAAIPERHPCMEGWESKCLFNYDYQIVNLSEPEFEFMQQCDRNLTKTVGEILTQVPLELNQVRSLLTQQLIMLTPS